MHKGITPRMIAYFDMFSGISGDMTLGAFIDLGVPKDWIENSLSDILDGFRLRTNIVFRNHLRATDLVVEVTTHDPPSRNYTDIKALIENSALPLAVKENSLAAFQKIAAAESIIHGKDIETVHFHEIGGIDSIVDIIGSFLCVEYLGIKQVFASPVPLGSGFVTCAHGKIPVPVPATLAILKDIPVKSSDATTEIVTPTGAAIVTTLAAFFGVMPGMRVKQSGYGAGKRDTGSSLPNLLRIVLGEDPGNQLKSQLDNQGENGTAIHQETISVAKTNVDDMSPEISGFLMETLLEAGALDVCFFPVQMKKNRPGIQIEVMCRQEDLSALIHLILSQTTSIGVRHHTCDRSFLARENSVVDTSFGPVQVKKIINPDHTLRFVPEYEGVRKLAKDRQIPFKEVYARIMWEANLKPS